MGALSGNGEQATTVKPTQVAVSCLDQRYGSGKKIGDISTERSQIKSLNEEEVEVEEKSWPDEFTIPDSLKEEIFIKHVFDFHKCSSLYGLPGSF